MELTWKLDRVPRPGSATVRVTDLGLQGLLNPSPSVRDDGDLLVDEYLSPCKLVTLTGLDDLRQVRALEMRVDTRENSLGNFGVYLPNLKQLKLNNSVLTSVRDLGTALSHLQVLWMARCGLSDLDGISSCCCLKELYVAYNNIADLSPVSLLEHLEILDLEGNSIEDIGQVQYLGLCTKLTTLTMEGNLMCLKPSPQSTEVPDYNYRAEVNKLIPHLKSLDEVPANQTAIPCKMNKDWLLVKESIKEGSIIEEAADSHSGSVTRRPCSAGRPATSNFLSASRPQTAQRPPTAHLLSSNNTFAEPTVSEEIAPEDDSSDLTHGVSRVICGNPIKALHARRQKLGSTATNTFQPPCHPDGSEEARDVNVEDIFAELRIWTEQYNQCPHAIPREKALQVLKVTHSDEEEEAWSLSDSCDEDSKEVNSEDLKEKMPPDSSSQSGVSQSSSDSLHASENALPALIKHPLVPSPPKCPSPASIQGVKGGLVRGRRLKVSSSEKGALLKPTFSSTVNRDVVKHVVEKTTVLSLCGKPDASSNISISGQRYRTCGSISKPTRRPISGPAAMGSTNIRAIVESSLHKMISPHHPAVHSCTKTPETLAVLNVGRPPTAKASLQSLPSRPNLSMITQSKFPEL
ncbi:PREDICTED: leucine-rich repeat-containing protein 56 [Gekko japonicus]|uniref:Leucine-rich repeat-containing protein 56 n=1 Tax=Gekko japonicus TaxID=146911 RepID=A0ABM1JI09_GEKJA|nr:PREDICTED: leucine-rich repeat-containing protein 56 [Gekko japonicus]